MVFETEKNFEVRGSSVYDCIKKNYALIPNIKSALYDGLMVHVKTFDPETQEEAFRYSLSFDDSCLCIEDLDLDDKFVGHGIRRTFIRVVDKLALKNGVKKNLFFPSFYKSKELTDLFESQAYEYDSGHHTKRLTNASFGGTQIL